MLIYVFYCFAALLIWQGIVSLLGGRRYLAFFRRALHRDVPDYAPRASVCVPCRGVDQGLRENLDALFAQHYPAYEIVFVTDCADDSSLAVIEAARQRWAHMQQPTTRVVVAGAATVSGQKVHNLIHAVSACDPVSEVFVFVDTDARPRPDWLRALVAPLIDESIGATTGYRWFVPTRGGLAAHLRSVWNASIASALGDNERRNFCWGGSTATRRMTFAKLDMLQRWRGTLSDDFALTRALHEAQLNIRFVPACLTATHEDCTFRELLEFTTRQLKITRVYAPTLWLIVLVSNLLFVATFYSGLAFVASRWAHGASAVAPLSLLIAIYGLGAAKAALRLRAVSLVFDAKHQQLTSAAWLAHLTLWPLTAALYAANALAAASSRRITWRGIHYELRSPTETVIIRHAPQH